MEGSNDEGNYDQHVTSPVNIHALSSKQVMRIKVSKSSIKGKSLDVQRIVTVDNDNLPVIYIFMILKMILH